MQNQRHFQNTKQVPQSHLFDELQNCSIKKSKEERDRTSSSTNHMSFKELEKWSNENVIILKTAKQRMNFKKLFQSDLTLDLANNTLVLVLKILMKVCHSPLNGSKEELMDLVVNGTFLPSLKSFVMHLQLQDVEERKCASYFWNNTDEFFGNVAEMSQNLLECVPNVPSNKDLSQTLTVIILSIPNFEQQQQISNETKQKFEVLLERLLYDSPVDNKITPEAPMFQRVWAKVKSSISTVFQWKDSGSASNKQEEFQPQESSWKRIYICSKVLCENNHPCRKKFYETCDPCTVLMKKTLPCTHEDIVPCSADPTDLFCQKLVRAQLPCGHTVTDKPCYQNTETYQCTFPCDTRVEPCGHACIRLCHIGDDPDHLQYKCLKPCTELKKGCSTKKHRCPMSCYEECLPCDAAIEKSRTVCSHRFTVPCSIDIDEVDCDEVVNKQLSICGHILKVQCSEYPNRKNCVLKCPLRLTCGHPCQEKCNEPCTKHCKVIVDHIKPLLCGHKLRVVCYSRFSAMPADLYKNCNEPCRVTLNCSHPCSGSCSGCAQGRIHESCKEKCGVPLICGHECLIPCREACQPCTRLCSYRCKHSICKKNCGEPCTNCTENCERRCQHFRCTAKCGQMCTVPPCKEPCDKQLACGHPCVGYCGDPCPPLCRICNQDELTQIFLGFEDDEDARFVLLDECRHVIESQGMDGWLQQGGNEITHKCCPKCKTALASTLRYSEYIKQAIEDITEVKKRFFGTTERNESKRLDLKRWLRCLELKSQHLRKYSPTLRILLANIDLSLDPIRDDKRQPLSRLQGRAYTSKMQIIEHIISTFNQARLKDSQAITKAATYANFLLQCMMQIKQRITSQQIEDFQMELKRFSRIVQWCQIRDSSKFLPVTSHRRHIKARYELVETILFAVSAYSNDSHEMLKEELNILNQQIDTGLRVTEEERQEIIKAMGMQRGHWFKCPNGHVYAIGECGGAMEVGKCFECGEAIGGRSHSLLSSNQHSGEMDGSQYAAWSSTANNMFNYEEFRD